VIVQDVVAGLVRVILEILLIIWLYAETGFLSITVIAILITIGHEIKVWTNELSPTRQAERELERTMRNFFQGKE